MVVSVLLIGGLTLAEGGLLARLLGRPVPVFLGRISYGTYLWHWPVIVALTTLFSTSPLVIATFAFGISTGLAALSYEVLEMPIRKASVLNGLRWQTAVVGVGASALVAATLVPAVLHLDRKPALASASAAPAVEKLSGAAGAKPIPGDIDWAKVDGDVGGQGWCTADDPSACTVVKGSGPHVLLVGDSQAQMLVPMFEKLAHEHDLTLSLNVLAGCPWQEGLSNGKQSPDSAKTLCLGPGRLVRQGAAEAPPRRRRAAGPSSRRPEGVERPGGPARRAASSRSTRRSTRPPATP